MKRQRKIKHNKKMCRAHDLGFYAHGQGRNEVKGKKLCLSNISKSTKANLTKLNRMIEHYEKVCCTQKLGSYAQGHGYDQVRGQIVPKIVLLINYSRKFDKTSQKD